MPAPPDEKPAIQLKRVFHSLMSDSQDSDPYVALCAASILSHLAANDDMLELFHNKEMDCVGLLCLTLRHAEEEEMQRVCVKAIGLVVAHDEGWQLHVAKRYQLLQTLLDKLTPQFEFKLQASAVESLAQICGNPKLQREMLTLLTSRGVPALEALLGGLEHPSLLVQSKTASTIAALCVHAGVREALCTGGRERCIPMLLKLTARDNREAQYQGCRALLALAEDERAHGVLRDETVHCRVCRVGRVHGLLRDETVSYREQGVRGVRGVRGVSCS